MYRCRYCASAVLLSTVWYGTGVVRYGINGVHMCNVCIVMDLAGRYGVMQAVNGGTVWVVHNYLAWVGIMWVCMGGRGSYFECQK
jgi:hypothetical protein